MKFLTKRNIIIAVSVLLISALVVTYLILDPPFASELTEFKRAKLIYFLQNGDLAKEVPPVLEPGTGRLITENYPMYYYGTYNGYDVFFSYGMVGMSFYRRIGDELFLCKSSGKLYLHLNGKFIPLEEAYDQGLISAESLRKAAQIHYDRVALYSEYRELGFGERYEGK